jgi:alkanesulfonate monooxygenase SsuD/methylene tetrahydromethanopterin reductase-like flavin-dependent oxidoreductase (luciferase family)
VHIGTGFLFHVASGAPDPQRFAQQASLIEQAETLGFESIWISDHAFSRHQTSPNAAQLLAWLAGKTRHALIGSIVSLETWHNPIRVAESLAALDLLSEGRLMFGVGRGLGPIDFDGYQSVSAEPCARITEYVHAIAGALETGVLSSPGPLYKQPPVAIYPRASLSFQGRMYAMMDSAESARAMAALGFGLLVMANKPWEAVLREARDYAELYASIHDRVGPRPVLLSLTSVDADPARARAWHDTYAAPYGCRTIDQGRTTVVCGTGRPQGVYQSLRFMQHLQLHGTPQQVVEATIERVRSLDAAALINILAMDGMPTEVARRNLVTYARDVLPQLKAVDAHRTIGRISAQSAASVLSL